MGMYRKEWECCNSVTETEAWEPESCPFCPPAPAVVQAEVSEVRPVAEVAESHVYLLCKQPNGERWPVGTKLYAAPQPQVTGDLSGRVAFEAWWQARFPADVRDSLHADELAFEIWQAARLPAVFAVAKEEAK